MSHKDVTFARLEQFVLGTSVVKSKEEEKTWGIKDLL